MSERFGRLKKWDLFCARCPGHGLRARQLRFGRAGPKVGWAARFRKTSRYSLSIARWFVELGDSVVLFIAERRGSVKIQPARHEDQAAAGPMN